VDAVINRKKTTDGFEYAGPLTEAVQLGNIAARVPGKTLTWDTEAFRLQGPAEAIAMLTKEYRPGFGIG
jgi:hypothetical protein